MSTLPELQTLLERIRAFNNARDWEQYHTPKNLAMGLMIEAAELAEHFLWLESKESRSLSPERIKRVKDEIGDVLIHLLNLADKLGINPVAAANEKLDHNADKYPADRARGKALKYDEYETSG